MVTVAVCPIAGEALAAWPALLVFVVVGRCLVERICRVFALCRVPDVKHTAKSVAHGKLEVSNSVSWIWSLCGTSHKCSDCVCVMNSLYSHAYYNLFHKTHLYLFLLFVSWQLAKLHYSSPVHWYQSLSISVVAIWFLPCMHKIELEICTISPVALASSEPKFHLSLPLWRVPPCVVLISRNSCK